MADTCPQVRQGRWAAMDQLADSRRAAAGRQQPTQSGRSRHVQEVFVFALTNWMRPAAAAESIQRRTIVDLSRSRATEF